MGLAASPAMEGPVFIQVRKEIAPKFMRGIVPKTEKNVSKVSEQLLPGSKYEIDEDEALIGRELANELGLGIGDKVRVHSPERLSKMVELDDDGNITEREDKEVYKPEELVIAGIFDVGMFEFDSQVMLVHLDKADELFGHDWDTASVIHIRTEDPFALDPIIEEMRKHDEFTGLTAITWKDANRRLFGALAAEKNMMFFLLAFIVLVSVFGITSTLVTVAIQKTREIGVLKALGGGPQTILMVFILQGGIVGAVGVVGGTIMGLLVVAYRNVLATVLAKITGVEIFPADLYQLSTIPALVNPADMARIVIISFVLCVLGAVLPALYATRLTPAEALRAG
jgi:lipoprotein-releasing system permease protein